MNACQKSTVSCFACCGIANLQTDAGMSSILQERTQEFHALHMDENLFRGYRLQREEKESKIPRHNPEIYVCPFLGYIEPGRPGCLIHPARTGKADSQNYSFYGASICLNYDCRAKEAEESLDAASEGSAQSQTYSAEPGSMQSNNAAMKDARAGSNDARAPVYSDFLEATLPDQYHRLICDSALYSLLETIPGFPASVCRDAQKSKLLGRLLSLRLKEKASRRITSFERLMVRAYDAAAAASELFPSSREEALQQILELKTL